MLTSGDVVDLELGTPKGRQAGFHHPAVLVAAQRILDAEPSLVHVVPLTRTIRSFGSEITVEPDDVNGLEVLSATQCQHIRAVSLARITAARGNVGAGVLAQLRESLAVLLDLPRRRHNSPNSSARRNGWRSSHSGSSQLVSPGERPR